MNDLNPSVTMAEQWQATNKMLLEKSIEFEKCKTENKLLTGFLSFWLDEFEGLFDNGDNDSYEAAEAYVSAATYMKRQHGRDDSQHIREVEEWIEKYVPWEH